MIGSRSESGLPSMLGCLGLHSDLLLMLVVRAGMIDMSASEYKGFVFSICQSLFSFNIQSGNAALPKYPEFSL